MRVPSLVLLFIAGASALPSQLLNPTGSADPADNCAGGQKLFTGDCFKCELTPMWGRKGWSPRQGLLILRREDGTPFDPTTEAVTVGEVLNLEADAALEYDPASSDGGILRAWMADGGALTDGELCLSLIHI